MLDITASHEQVVAHADSVAEACRPNCADGGKDGYQADNIINDLTLYQPPLDLTQM
jgi:hypothetical protein